MQDESSDQIDERAVGAVEPARGYSSVCHAVLVRLPSAFGLDVVIVEEERG